jgi:protein involved in polysaccharide export with SLBB domain
MTHLTRGGGREMLNGFIRKFASIAIAAATLLGVAAMLSPASAQQLDGGMGGLSTGDGGLGGSKAQELMEQLNISLPQMQQLREQSSGSGEGNLQTQRICAGIAARHLTPDEAQSVGHALGMSDDGVQRLVECARRSSTNSREMDFGKQGLIPIEPQTEEPSYVEKQFHAADSPYKQLAAPELSQLKQFGYDLFSTADQNQVSTFDNVPVGPDYVVGPGDQLNLLLWGRINKTLMLTVQRDGTVQIPQVGPLPIAGLSFAQAQKLINGQITQIEGVQADVTMGRLRTIEVFVIGQVAHPGLQTLSSLSHVSDALSAAGGALKTGSLRKVEVRREGHSAALVDLYAMLLHGDTSSDVRLQPRDVVFVPVVGPVVAIAGNVKNPAIYELRGTESLRDALRMAGGVGAFGYAQRIQVERVENHARRVMLDLNFNQASPPVFGVADGDLVKVFSVLPEQKNVVKLEGNVNRPGSYEWRSGMRVADLVRQGQGVRDRTYLDYALLRRREGPTRSTHFLKVDLGDAISSDVSAADLALQPEDSLTIYSVGEIDQIPTVSVSGAVRKPGTYPLTDGMRATDLIYLAGGLKESAYLGSAQLARTSSDGLKARQVFQTFNLKSAVSGTPADDPTLGRSDSIFIAEASNWHLPWIVRVRGEAMRPGPYVIHEGETLGSVLERCGGIRSDGYLPALILIRQSVLIMQQKVLERASTEVQTQLTRAALVPAENNVKQEPNLQEKAQALMMLKDMLAGTESKAAVGRIVLNVPASLAALQGSAADVPLEEKDEIIVPKRPAAVNVVGEVHGATAVMYDPSLTVADYIDRAGGFTQTADKEEMFVIKANGSIISENGLRDSRKSRVFPLLPLVSGGLMSSHLQPGDTVYIPPQFLFINPIQRTLDITQIVANSAQGIAYAALLGTLL